MTESWNWVKPMRKVAKAFDGHEGVFLQLGDSLTLAAPNTRWARTGRGQTADERAFLKWAHAGEKNARDGWHLATTTVVMEPPVVTSHTADTGCSARYLLTGRRAHPPLAELIERYDPQLVVYAIGVSDIIRKTPVSDYIADVARAVDLLEANGTVPILSTVTPSRDRNDDVLIMNDSLRGLARARRLPLLDIYSEMERRKPNILEYLEDDGIHLTSTPPDGPPTEANFSTSGYLLRCYLTVRKGMEIRAKVLRH